MKISVALALISLRLEGNMFDFARCYGRFSAKNGRNIAQIRAFAKRDKIATKFYSFNTVFYVHFYATRNLKKCQNWRKKNDGKWSAFRKSDGNCIFW